MTLSTRAATASIVLLLGAAAGLQAARDRTYAELASPASTLYVRSGPALDRLALSFDALLADVYWIRAIQYFGRTRLSDAPAKSYEDLYPLLEITTTLDPQFNVAYRFGAIFLSEGYPDGPAQPELAMRLLEKGFDANPGRWQYPHDIAFVNYWWLRDYAQAARWFEVASEVPGAPVWLEPLAAVTLTRGGDRESARQMWRQILDTAEHDFLRRAAEHRLMQLAVLDQLDALQGLLDRYAAETGRRAGSWQPLVSRGWIPGVPTDPEGAPYRIDAASGRVRLSPESRFFPLPVEGAERTIQDAR